MSESTAQVTIEISCDAGMSEIDNSNIVTAATYDQPGGPIAHSWPSMEVPVHQVEYESLFSGSLLQIAQEMILNTVVESATISIPNSTEWQGAIFATSSAITTTALISANHSRNSSILAPSLSMYLGVRGGPELVYQMFKKTASGATNIIDSTVFPNTDNGCLSSNEEEEFDNEDLAATLQNVGQGDIVKFRVKAQWGELYLKSKPDTCNGLGPGTQSIFDSEEETRQYFLKNGSLSFTVNGQSVGAGNEAVVENGNQIFFSGGSRYFVKKAGQSKFSLSSHLVPITEFS